MSQGIKTNRFFAAVLMAGGVTGMVMAVVMGIKLLSSQGMGGLAMGLLLLPFGWATYIGNRLWKGTPSGRRWALVVFALQVPMLGVSGLRYEWFTGANLGPVLMVVHDKVSFSLNATLGANGQFFLGYQLPGVVLGVNLFALLAVILLVRANRPSVRMG